MIHDKHLDGVLRERWDDVVGTYTEFDAAGTIVTTRPLTDDEVAQLAESAAYVTTTTNQSTVETNLNEDLDAMQAIIDQTNDALRTDPSQELKDVARATRRLIRMALDDFSGTE